MVAVHIVRRDLMRFLRNPTRTALLFALPLFMAGVFAVVFGSGGGSSVTIRVLLWDEDDSLLSRLLQGAGDSSRAEGRLDVVAVGPEGLEMIDAGEASALVHLPAGFFRALLDGSPTTVEVIKNPAQRFLPQVVEEGVTLGAAVLSAGTRVFRPELDQLKPIFDAESAPEDLAVAALSTSVNQRMRQLQQYVLPPVVNLTTSTADADTEATSSISADILAIFLPGLAMMGTLFIAQTATRDVVRERANGLLRQLLTAPVSPGEYLLGKSLSTVLVSVFGFGVMLAVGVVAGVHWGRPELVAALALASAVAASGTLLLLMSIVGSERQGDAVTTVVIMVWCMLGGAFVPISEIPDVLAPLSRASLVFWSVDGFQRLSAQGPDPISIAGNLAVLAGCGGGFLALGSWLLYRRIARGEL